MPYRNAIYGSEVRESIAESMEVTNELTENTKTRQDNLDGQFQAVLDVITDKDFNFAPEIKAARAGEDGTQHLNLKDRLDDEQSRVTAQLAHIQSKTKQSDVLLKVGNLELPTDFPLLPFTITKKAEGLFAHNYDVNHIHDWSGATEVFIAEGATPGYGTSSGTPIAF